MTLKELLIICFTVLLSASAIGQQKYPPLFVPNPTSPPIAAFMTWHQSLLNGDFLAYKNTSFWAPTMKEELKKQMFDHFRSTTPTVVKISEQKTNPNGSIGFYAVGCKDNVRLINVITVGNTDGAWRVAASGWGPPWNETAKLCPV